MGHQRSAYWLQTSECIGTYSNPYKRGGKGARFSKWKTIDGRNFLPEAKEMWLQHYRGKDSAKLVKFRVRYKNQTVINPEGRVYELYVQPGTNDKWMRFVEALI